MATLITLTAIHKPSGTSETYGPWDKSDDPQVFLANVSFAHGFLSGFFSAVMGETYNIEDFEFKSEEVEDGPHVVGQIVAEASATVTHPDGSITE